MSTRLCVTLALVGSVEGDFLARGRPLRLSGGLTVHPALTVEMGRIAASTSFRSIRMMRGPKR
jgi:hypothetical protein